MLRPLEELIMQVLQWFYGITADYGWAIVLLTLAMRMVILPLTLKQTKSMYEMQRIQPKIKELQAKYKDNKEKLQEETLKFYQENKVNPFGGCLPLILQMPIFFALFRVLGSQGKKPGLLLQHIASLPAEAAEAAKRFWIILPDITRTPSAVFAQDGVVAALPYLAFVVLFGLSVWLPQQLMPGDPSQKRIGLYMAVMMLWFGWITPGGVLVYWVVSSVLQIVQQQATLAYIKKSEGE